MGSKAVSSAKAIIIGGVISNGISMASSIILAHFLFENDYGSLVLMTLFAGLITQIGNMGYEIYYIRFKGTEEEDKKLLDNIFKLRLLTNILLFVVQFLIGSIIYFATKDKMSGALLMISSVAIVIEAFNTPNEALLKKKMDFKSISIGNIIKVIAISIGQVGGAVMHLGGLSFGVGILMGSIARFFYIVKIQPYKPNKRPWNSEEIAPIFNFGKHLLFGSIGMYLVQQIDRIFLGWFYPKNIVGQYGFAWTNAAIPYNYIVSPQQQLVLVYASKHNEGDKSLSYKLFIILKLINTILTPILIFAILFTSEGIGLVLGSKWLSIAPLLKILLTHYFFLSITFPFASLLTAMGYAKKTSRLTLLKAAGLIISLFTCAYVLSGNILEYAIVFSVVSISFDINKAWKGLRKTGIGFKETMRTIRIELIFTVMVIGVMVASFFPLLLLTRILLFIACMAVIGVVNLKFDRQRLNAALEIVKLKRKKKQVPHPSPVDSFPE